jgi:hypothetical protein
MLPARRRHVRADLKRDRVRVFAIPLDHLSHGSARPCSVPSRLKDRLFQERPRKFALRTLRACKPLTSAEAVGSAGGLKLYLYANTASSGLTLPRISPTAEPVAHGSRLGRPTRTTQSYLDLC